MRMNLSRGKSVGKGEQIRFVRYDNKTKSKERGANKADNEVP